MANQHVPKGGKNEQHKPAPKLHKEKQKEEKRFPTQLLDLDL